MSESLELFTPAWFSALAAIVLIDLVLAGDNAIVIGLAARNVPAQQQKRVIWWGTLGAIVVRALLTGAVVWLLKIPGFLLVGGLALIYIGWKLTRAGGSEHHIEARHSVRAAVQTIVIADAVMGVDNVLAVGGAAHGSWLLVIIGLAISIPVVVWGSTIVLRWVERFPAIVWLGAAVLGWTAAKMITSEPLLSDNFVRYPAIPIVLQVLVVFGLTAPSVWRSLGPRDREHAIALLIVAAWLGAWGALGPHFGAVVHGFDEWTFGDEFLDLLRWTGWIPLVVLVSRRGRRDVAAANAGRSLK
ncbi:MAG TPA: TerC family protein [Casimicrobiaceae bacterium]|nr:TerC family protein [Casimicrobiaceae bacterium]